MLHGNTDYLTPTSFSGGKHSILDSITITKKWNTYFDIIIVVVVHNTSRRTKKRSEIRPIWKNVQKYSPVFSRPATNENLHG